MSLLREDLGPVAVLTIAAPPENALDVDVLDALDAQIAALEASADIDVVVIRGAGQGFFCGGGAFGARLDATLERLAALPQYTLAALSGHAHGAGLHLALACDARVARAGGPTVGFPRVDVAELPGPSARARLVAALGPSRALGWVAEGRSLTVEDAAAVGIVGRVLPAQGWWDQVLGIARAWARPAPAAAVVRAWKRGAEAAAQPVRASVRHDMDAASRASVAAPNPKAAAPEEAPRRAGDAPPGPAPVRPSSPAASLVHTRPSAAADALATFAEPTEEDDDPVSAPRPRAGSGYASAAPRSAAERGPGEFAGFEDFADDGDLDEAPDGAFGGGFGGPPRAGGIDRSRARISDATLNLLTRDLVERHRAMPVRHDAEEIVVAMADPGNTAAVAEIAAHTGRRVVPVRAPVEDIAALVVQHYRA
jgi:enoyl-CoA hydratase